MTFRLSAIQFCFGKYVRNEDVKSVLYFQGSFRPWVNRIKFCEPGAVVEKCLYVCCAWARFVCLDSSEGVLCKMGKPYELQLKW